MQDIKKMESTQRAFTRYIFNGECQSASVASRLPQSPGSGGSGAAPPAGAIFCERGGPRAILALDITTINVAINMQLMYIFLLKYIKI